MLLQIAFALAVCAYLLALHHLYIHQKDPPPDGIEDLCLLQPKDFCACHCTHENWILAFGLGAFTLFVLSFLA